MKINRRTFLFFFLIIQIISACKKDNDEPNNNEIISPACDSNLKFNVILSEAMYPKAVCEAGNGNILILGSNNDNAKVVEVSYNGTFLRSNNYPLNSGSSPQHILQLNENSFFFSSANMITSDSAVYPYNGWYLDGFTTDSAHQCHEYYFMGATPGTAFFTTSSTSQLFRIDSSLNVVWTKEFSGVSFEGKSLTKIDNHNFIFITYHSGGFVPHPVFDTFGVFLDTVKYDYYDNSITVYKIDDNGNVLWQKDVSNIYSSDFYVPGAGCDVVTVGTKIYLRAQREIIVLNSNGEIFSRSNVHGYCDEQINKITALGANGFVCEETDFINNELIHFLTKFNSSGLIQWDKTLTYFNGGTEISSFADGKIFDYGDGDGIKYDENGDLIWTVQLNISIYSTGTCGCNGGAIVVGGTSYYDMHIYKTDANGNYQ